MSGHRSKTASPIGLRKRWEPPRIHNVYDMQLFCFIHSDVGPGLPPIHLAEREGLKQTRRHFRWMVNEA